MGWEARTCGLGKNRGLRATGESAVVWPLPRPLQSPRCQQILGCLGGPSSFRATKGMAAHRACCSIFAGGLHVLSLLSEGLGTPGPAGCRVVWTDPLVPESLAGTHSRDDQRCPLGASVIETIGRRGCSCLPWWMRREEAWLGGHAGRHICCLCPGAGLVSASDWVFVALAEELEYVGRNNGVNVLSV